jgi:glycogen debranching enzyme GlgX
VDRAVDRLSDPGTGGPRRGEASGPPPTGPLSAGLPWPLGAHADARGVNVAVFSAHATAVDLCVFDSTGAVELARHRLPGRTQDVWHGHLPGARPGLIYGLRAHGPWRPERGHRFNPAKLLLDPAAREIVGHFEWREEHFGADRDHPTHPDPRDNAAFALKARVIEPGGSALAGAPSAPRPRIAAEDTVLYEVHVKGFTRRHPGVPAAQRGTYAGLASDAAIDHLRRLGITTLSLLPVHQHLDEERLDRLGLRNYWGYNTIGFFAVEPSLAGGMPGLAPREEFLWMVRRLHRAGFEVLVDVVFNHTAEGDETGPTLSWRGLDNASYYRLERSAPQRYENHTGCGNTLDLRHPRVLQMVMDSLRYWAQDLEVDGFRFDLAPVLARGDAGFDRAAPFFAAVAQDPLLSRLKLVAEPWDIGPGGYQLGSFPRGWMEWNDRFRDAQRAFWLGATGDGPAARTRAVDRGAFALRLAGSSDLFQASDRAPTDSVNFVVAHDGFTLADLVTYEQRRNEANGESNRDGHGHNLGWNCGVEGPSDDAAVRDRRARLQRALLATLLLAQGTPMLAAGSELGHTQRGNNNAYCQDSEISWIDWSSADSDLIAFTARLLALRRQALPLAARWYNGLTDPRGLHDLTWLEPDGSPLEGDGWRDPSRSLACLIGRPGRARAPLLVLVNADPQDRLFHLPAGVWRCWLDSGDARGASSWHGQGDAPYPVAPQCLHLLAAAGADFHLPRDASTQAAAPLRAADRPRTPEADA